MILSYRLIQRLLVINRVPLLGRILHIGESGIGGIGRAEKTKEYWQDALYAKNDHLLTIKILGKSIGTLSYKIDIGDIYLNRKYTAFFNSLDEMIQKGFVQNLDSRSRIFEPGCNVGVVLKKLQRMYNCEVYGMDISRDAIAFANRNVFRNNNGATFFTGDVLDYDFFRRFEDNFFDLSYCVSHLIHVETCEEKTRYIEELKRISKCVLFFERINPGREHVLAARNFEDYEKEYGFTLFKTIEKTVRIKREKRGKLIGVYFYRKNT